MRCGGPFRRTNSSNSATPRRLRRRNASVKRKATPLPQGRTQIRSLARYTASYVDIRARRWRRAKIGCNPRAVIRPGAPSFPRHTPSPSIHAKRGDGMHRGNGTRGQSRGASPNPLFRASPSSLRSLSVNDLTRRRVPGQLHCRPGPPRLPSAVTSPQLLRGGAPMYGLPSSAPYDRGPGAPPEFSDIASRSFPLPITARPT